MAASVKVGSFYTTSVSGINGIVAEYFNSRTIDEYDMTSYENTLSVRGLTTDDFTWIGNENNVGNLPTVNVSPSYDTPERSVVEELVNTYWPNDMAIYNTSLTYNDITPSYLL